MFSARSAIIDPFFVLILTAFCYEPLDGCNSVQRRSSNDVKAAHVNLFTYETSGNENPCLPSGDTAKKCYRVRVHEEALRDARLRFPLDPDDEDAVVVLKKVSQQGMEYLNDEEYDGDDGEESAKTTTVSYKVR